VKEGQLSGVESGTVQTLEDAEGLFASSRRASGAAVISVSNYRESRFRKMDPNLVCPPCLDADQEQRG
jgi:hypothetical protein